MKKKTMEIGGTQCKRTRLAAGNVAAVDICDCGVMAVHVGATTLRMTPGAVAELLSTLGQAVAEQSSRLRGTPDSRPFMVSRRGEA